MKNINMETPSIKGGSLSEILGESTKIKEPFSNFIKTFRDDTDDKIEVTYAGPLAKFMKKMEVSPPHRVATYG